MKIMHWQLLFSLALGYLSRVQLYSVFLTDDELQRAETTLDSIQALSSHPDTSAQYSLTNFEGDIRRPPATRAFAAVRNISLLWPDGKVIYAIEDTFNTTQRLVIAAAIVDFQRQTCIQFVPHTTERAYLEFAKGPDCSSLVGYQYAYMWLSLADACFRSHGVILHEILHAIGFWHEQARTDRDQYVTVVFDNVADQAKEQFDKYAQDKIQHLNEPYDYESVMHYGRNAFSKNGRDTIIPKQPGVTIGQREGFSAADIRKVNKLYKCTSNEIWYTWNPWSRCAASCGAAGLRKRSRVCSKRNSCLGQASQRENCVNSCGWNTWGVWSSCGSSCGPGHRARIRTCPVSGACGEQWDSVQLESCNDTPCSLPVRGIVLIGGYGYLSDNSMEVYNPENLAENRELTTKLETRRYYHVSGVLQDGSIVIAGGRDLSSVELFQPYSDTIASASPMSTDRSLAGGAVLNDTFYVCGGFNSDTSHSSCEKFEKGRWEPFPSMNHSRHRFSMVALDGALYAIGGYSVYEVAPLASVHMFRIINERPDAEFIRTWVPVASMNIARNEHSACVLGNIIYVCGGEGTEHDCERYDSKRDVWEIIASTKIPREFFSLVTLGGKVYAVGGANGAERSVERYDPRTNSWTVLGTELKQERLWHNAVVI